MLFATRIRRSLIYLLLCCDALCCEPYTQSIIYSSDVVLMLFATHIARDTTSFTQFATQFACSPNGGLRGARIGAE